jgi:hypothetical protein
MEGLQETMWRWGAVTQFEWRDPRALAPSCHSLGVRLAGRTVGWHSQRPGVAAFGIQIIMMQTGLDVGLSSADAAWDRSGRSEFGGRCRSLGEATVTPPKCWASHDDE